jgi:hypothetical protein
MPATGIPQAKSAGSAPRHHTTIGIDCRVCSDRQHGRQIAGTATTELTLQHGSPEALTGINNNLPESQEWEPIRASRLPQ